MDSEAPRFGVCGLVVLNLKLPGLGSEAQMLRLRTLSAQVLALSVLDYEGPNLRGLAAEAGSSDV